MIMTLTIIITLASTMASALAIMSATMMMLAITILLATSVINIYDIGTPMMTVMLGTSATPKRLAMLMMRQVTGLLVCRYGRIR